jgi:hypothetical protein
MRHGRSILTQHARDITRQHINLEIDPVTWLFRSQRRVSLGMGYQIDTKSVSVNLIDSQ